MLSTALAGNADYPRVTHEETETHGKVKGHAYGHQPAAEAGLKPRPFDTRGQTFNRHACSFPIGPLFIQ